MHVVQLAPAMLSLKPLLALERAGAIRTGLDHGDAVEHALLCASNASMTNHVLG